jgi:alpha-ketoglutarate-dependent taurine dioxygenase
MPELLTHPLKIPAAWRGADIESDPAWIYTLDGAVIQELHTTLAAVEKTRQPLFDITPQTFALPSFRDLRRKLLVDVEGGRGFALIRGLPIGDLSEQQAATLFWGLGAHLGTPEPQDAAGNLLHHVRNTGRDLSEDDVRKYQTNQDIPFHNDGSDIFLLLCVRNAKSGGSSRLVSTTTVFNEIVPRRPDLAEVLQHPFHFDARGQQQPGQPRAQIVPIYSYHEGRLSTIHKRFYIDLAQRFPEVPDLTKQQVEALDLFDEICARPGVCLEFDMQPGDILVASNYDILHCRTAFEDYDEPARRRHMMRLWLTIPDGRPLPPVFASTREFQHSYARRHSEQG